MYAYKTYKQIEKDYSTNLIVILFFDLVIHSQSSIKVKDQMDQRNLQQSYCADYESLL